jgi:(1->4)-alpha-D-glucan 1-alpha-D-glucosylmutase
MAAQPGARTTCSRIPTSTYRLQFHRGFGFADARALVSYLARLGITDCYSSPYLKASPGSTHGYDICDHNELNPELGSDDDYARFTAELAAHGMGQVVDFVPNHMGVNEAANPWWRDVLENGSCSPVASFFDIDWQPVKTELKDKVLLPILGDQYGFVLERAELTLCFEHGGFTLRYFDHDLPVNPRAVPRILEHDLEALRTALGEDAPDFLEYLSIVTALRNLPVYTETDSARVQERHREKQMARERLARLAEATPRIRQHIEGAVHAFNGHAGEPRTFDRLHALLEAQPYRLSYWRTASHEINYRRFFDINQLAGLRMEDARVFAAAHGLILRLVREGKVTGIRIDHIDGLFDPVQYLERLQQAVCAPAVDGNPVGEPALYVVTEKILSAGEALPERWPVAGTSGYDFLNDLNGIFVDRRNYRALLRVYRRFCGVRRAFQDIVYDSKKLIMDTPMSSELNVLAHALNRLSEHDRRTRDFTLNSLRDALKEVVACFPVYRTYVAETGFTEADRAAIDTAVHRARRRNPTMEPSVFAFVRETLLPEPSRARGPEDHQRRLAFAMKFQQYTGPVQAKGVEDTAFYRYNALLSLNEVGGDPGRFGCSPADFHARNQQRRQHWPFTMLASSTHDSKRGEDARARLNVLSELPEEWGHHLTSWAKINLANRMIVDGERAPDRNDEYLFYQTLLAAWPPRFETKTMSPDALLVSRLSDYMLKAAREAKVHTSWITENPAYEAAVMRFVERTLNGPSTPRFLAAFLPFQTRIARLGMVNSLSQVVLKVVSPGVPDFYQGTELWDLSLVDPDNRRAVDYVTRRQMLASLGPFLRAPQEPSRARTDAVREMLAHWGDGRIKLFLTATALRLRRACAALFLHGSYEPLEAEGARAQHVVALARRHGPDTVIAVVPRLLTSVTTTTHSIPTGSESWGETRLRLPPDPPHRAYCNLFTGETVEAAGARAGRTLDLAAILRTCPVALLAPLPS